MHCSYCDFLISSSELNLFPWLYQFGTLCSTAAVEGVMRCGLPVQRHATVLFSVFCVAVKAGQQLSFLFHKITLNCLTTHPSLIIDRCVKCDEMLLYWLSIWNGWTIRKDKLGPFNTAALGVSEGKVCAEVSNELHVYRCLMAASSALWQE